MDQYEDLSAPSLPNSTLPSRHTSPEASRLPEAGTSASPASSSVLPVASAATEAGQTDSPMLAPRPPFTSRASSEATVTPHLLGSAQKPERDSTRAAIDSQSIVPHSAADGQSIVPHSTIEEHGQVLKVASPSRAHVTVHSGLTQIYNFPFKMREDVVPGSDGITQMLAGAEASDLSKEPRMRAAATVDRILPIPLQALPAPPSHGVLLYKVASGNGAAKDTAEGLPKLDRGTSVLPPDLPQLPTNVYAGSTRLPDRLVLVPSDEPETEAEREQASNYLLYKTVTAFIEKSQRKRAEFSLESLEIEALCNGQIRMKHGHNLLDKKSAWLRELLSVFKLGKAGRDLAKLRQLHNDTEALLLEWRGLDKRFREAETLAAAIHFSSNDIDTRDPVNSNEEDDNDTQAPGGKNTGNSDVYRGMKVEPAEPLSGSANLTEEVELRLAEARAKQVVIRASGQYMLKKWRFFLAQLEYQQCMKRLKAKQAHL